MLKYGKAYLEQNELALQQLELAMGARAYEVAIKMAPSQNDEEISEDEDDLETVAA